MHGSLPKELEDLVQERVDSGLYGSASEVVGAALRKFFCILEEGDDIDFEEGARIREVIKPRLESLRNGYSITHDFDEACEEINKEIFGS